MNEQEITAQLLSEVRTLRENTSSSFEDLKTRIVQLEQSMAVSKALDANTTPQCTLHQRRMDKFEEDHAKLKEQVQEINLKLGKYSGAVLGVVFLLQLIPIIFRILA